MVDLPELLVLIAELTSLLTATQKLADMVISHNAHLALVEAKFGATPAR